MLVSCYLLGWNWIRILLSNTRIRDAVTFRLLYLVKTLFLTENMVKMVKGCGQGRIQAAVRKTHTIQWRYDVSTRSWQTSTRALQSCLIRPDSLLLSRALCISDSTSPLRWSHMDTLKIYTPFETHLDTVDFFLSKSCYCNHKDGPVLMTVFHNVLILNILSTYRT